MKFIFLLLFVSLNLGGAVSSAQSNQSPIPSDLYGTWYYNLRDSVSSTKFYMTYSATQMRVRSECHWGGVFGPTLRAEVVSTMATDPNGNLYFPDQKDEKSVRRGSTTYNCTASVSNNSAPNKGTYKIVGDTLYIYDQNGQPVKDGNGSDVILRRVR